MRYLLFICSILIITNVTKAYSSNVKGSSVVTVSKRNDYIKSAVPIYSKKLPIQSSGEEKLLHKPPYKKIITDHYLPDNQVLGLPSMYILIINDGSNYLTDHPLHYFFLLFPQHYFW